MILGAALFKVWYEKLKETTGSCECTCGEGVKAVGFVPGPEQGRYSELEGRQLAAEVGGAGGQAILLRGAIIRVQNRLIRGVICAVAQICSGSKIDELEAPLLFGEHQIEWLHIAMHHSGVVQCLHHEQ